MMLYLYKIETYFCNQDQTNVNLNKLLFQSAGSALEGKNNFFHFRLNAICMFNQK